MVDVKLEHRLNLKRFVKYKDCEIVKMFQEVYDVNTMPRAGVFEQRKRFSGGQGDGETLQARRRCRRRKTNTTEMQGLRTRLRPPRDVTAPWRAHRPRQRLGVHRRCVSGTAAFVSAFVFTATVYPWPSAMSSIKI